MYVSSTACCDHHITCASSGIKKSCIHIISNLIEQLNNFNSLKQWQNFKVVISESNTYISFSEQRVCFHKSLNE